MAGAVLDRWLAEVVAARGLTAIREPEEARRALLDDALAGAELVSVWGGPIVDVGSGGGTPGIPLAASFPDRRVTLLEAERRKCLFLERWLPDLPNLEVRWGRAEEQPLETYGVAVAKALAPPPARERVARAAERVAGVLEDAPPGFLVIRKTGPTPAGFPRRPGVARKRPLA